MTTAEIARKMISYSKGNRHDVNHFMKVWAFAKTIGDCGGWLISHIPYTHRINPNLPLDKVNRVNNLVSVHKKCFDAIHNPGMDLSEFDGKAQKKILGYREKLGPSHTCNN